STCAPRGSNPSRPVRGFGEVLNRATPPPRGPVTRLPTLTPFTTTSKDALARRCFALTLNRPRDPFFRMTFAVPEARGACAVAVSACVIFVFAAAALGTAHTTAAATAPVIAQPAHFPDRLVVMFMSPVFDVARSGVTRLGRGARGWLRNGLRSRVATRHPR